MISLIMGSQVAGFTREHQIEGAPNMMILLKIEGTKIIKMVKNFPGMFGYKIHTTHGQSGGPMIIKKNNIRFFLCYTSRIMQKP